MNTARTRSSSSSTTAAKALIQNGKGALRGAFFHVLPENSRLRALTLTMCLPNSCISKLHHKGIGMRDTFDMFDEAVVWTGPSLSEEALRTERGVLPALAPVPAEAWPHEVFPQYGIRSPSEAGGVPFLSNPVGWILDTPARRLTAITLFLAAIAVIN